MRVQTVRPFPIVLLTFYCSLIRALSPNDVDASIAKLMNNYGPTMAPPIATAPVGSVPPPPSPSPVATPPETFRQSSLFGFGRLSQIPMPSPSPSPPSLPPPPPQSFQQQAKPSWSAPTLNLINGPVTGKRLTFNNLDSLPAPVSTNECQVFLGIPYAVPPIGELRFKAPKPAPRWSDSWEAGRYKPACMQNPKGLPRSFVVSEDCLHANVFKPAVPTPVTIVVWIHGGAFLTGSATMINPTTACRQVVVNTLTIITINYRLGPFGFPAHDSLSPNDTNLGLRDIALAVKWVQDNAMALGSQSDRIVLAGHGGGAALISHLLDSGLSLNEAIDAFPLTILDLASIKGVILMSGSGLAPWAITRHSWNSTGHLLKEFNCQYMFCLQDTDAYGLVEKSPRLWSPYVDNVTITASDARKIEPKRTDSRFPIIMGFTMQEGFALAVQKLSTVNGSPLKERITRSLVEFTGESKEEVERRYLYERATPIDFFETIYDFIDALSEAYSDLLFKLPSIREASARTQRQSSNVYVYAARHDVPLPGNSLPGYKASYHGSDLELFWSPYAKQSKVNLLGAFLQVLLHQEDNMPWGPWSPQSPMVLQVTPYGGQLIHFRPPDSFHNQSYYNTTVKYGNPGIAWTNNPPRKFTSINANATPVPILFSRKKIGPSTPSLWPSPTTPVPPSSPGVATATAPLETTTAASANVTITTGCANKTINVTNVSAEVVIPRETTTVLPNTTFATSTKSSAAPRANASVEGSAAPPAAATQQDSLVWVLLGLAVLFLFLFLITVGGCAAWNRQSYHPHPNRRSRHQGAKVRNGQARVPPPVAPLETSSGPSHQPPSHPPRSHRDGGNSEGKKSGHRMISHNQANNQTGAVTAAHRRPRQPPPSLPPLLSKDPKRS